MTDRTLQIQRIEKHLVNHPNDYQSVIQLMIIRSRQIDYINRKAMIPIKRRLSEINRRIKNEECS